MLFYIGTKVPSEITVVCFCFRPMSFYIGTKAYPSRRDSKSGFMPMLFYIGANVDEMHFYTN